MKPLVTTIITTFNRPESLKQAIESVRSDIYPNKEILVIDDCSSNDLKPFSELYQDVAFIKLKSQSGVAASRNEGINRSRGEYITFLDDDDIAYSSKISDLIGAALSFNTGFVFGRTIKKFISQEKKHILIPEEDYHNNDNYCWAPIHDFLLRMPSHNNAVLLRKQDIINVGGYSEDVYYFDDWAGWLKMIANGIKPLYLPQVVAEFRYHPDGLSHNVNRERSLTSLITDLLLKAVDYFKNDPHKQKILVALLSDIQNQDFQDYDEYVSFVLRNRDRYLKPESSWYPYVLDRSEMAVHQSLNITAPTIRDKMVDPPELEPAHKVEINRVGISGQEFYLPLITESGINKILAKIDVGVNLPPHFRGIHMSRIVGEIERLSETPWVQPLTFIRSLAAALKQIQHGSRVFCDMTVHFPFLVKLPESGKKHHQNLLIKCGIEDGILYSGLVVPHITACPCVQCYSECVNKLNTTLVPEKITHSQRAETTIIIWSEAEETILNIDLLSLCRQSLVIVNDMLKREDEFSLVFQAHNKAQFIEDCIRDLAYRLMTHKYYSELRKATISCRSFESIHTRDISAQIELFPDKVK